MANPFMSVSSVKQPPVAAAQLSSRRESSQQPDEKLNGGWVKYVDPDSGYPYYCNEKIEESTYDRPEGFSTFANPFISARGGQPKVSARQLSSRRDNSDKPKEYLNNGWVKYTDPESGWPYYYNEQTEESSYDRPEGFATSANPFGSMNADSARPSVPASSLSARRDRTQTAVERMNNGWVKYVDPATNYPYYWNEDTSESTYDRPEGFRTFNDPFSTMRMKKRGERPPPVTGYTISEEAESEDAEDKAFGGGDDNIMGTAGSSMDAMMATFCNRNEP
jgi:hypothetical protein